MKDAKIEIKVKRLRTLFNATFIVLIALLILIPFSIKQNLNRADLVKMSFQNKYKSYLFADELRQSSDDLTRMVRAYVTTNNAHYKSKYYAILNIRNGNIQTPTEYNKPYWDLILTTFDEQRKDSLSPKTSLRQKIINAQFTKNELKLLSKSEQESNNLVRLEEKAMAIIEDENSVDKISEQKKAINLLYSNEYHQAKAAIMTPIKEFYSLLEERTERQIVQEQKKALNTQILIVLQLVLIGMLVTFMFYFGRKISIIVI